MRELDLEEHPGARAVINIWSELGDQISVNLLVDPLVGCTWVGCRLFVQTEDGDDEYMSCAGCVFAQYCDVTCQRRYVSHTSAPLVMSNFISCPETGRNTKRCVPRTT